MLPRTLFLLLLHLAQRAVNSNNSYQNSIFCFIVIGSQMLTMRNGLSLHPMWLPGVLPSMQLPQTGMVFDEGNGLLNTNGGTETFSANEESSVQTGFNLSSQCTISNQPVALPSAANISTSETAFGLEPLIQAHYGPFTLPPSSKVNYTMSN